MDYGQLHMVADKFQWVFSASLLNTYGQEEQCWRRPRLLTPVVF